MRKEMLAGDGGFAVVSGGTAGCHVAALLAMTRERMEVAGCNVD